MSFRIKIQEVIVESQQKGRNKWQTATVTYTYNGQNRTQKLMSFTNPDVFKTVTGCAAGDELEVDITKNEEGYNQWSRVQKPGMNTPTAAAAAPTGGGKVLGSNYETPEERKLRQVLIVKQSSITNAIATLSPGAKAALDPKAVLTLAQEYVDFVYGINETLETMDSDLEALSN